MTDEQINHMADRFLMWKLPESFHPDAGVSFKPSFPNEPMRSRHWPVGTNLFDARQAEAMVRHMIEGLPDVSPLPTSIPMILTCPECGARHIDKGEFATKAHHTHACQHCGMVWRPALAPTVGVQFLPGFKNGE